MSNADKRAVHTDALDTLGTIITENEKRDAIHLAVEPAVAGQTLKPGQDVGFLPDGTVGACKRDELLGIVDPFLPQPIHKGDRFWLVVYPRQITSLRHVWTHPAFPEDTKEASEADVKTKPRAKAKPKAEIKPDPEPEDADKRRSRVWIEAYADDLGVSYNSLMARAKVFVDSGDYWCEGDRFDGEWVKDEFWDHYEVVTGESVLEDDRGSFFSCSC